MTSLDNEIEDCIIKVVKTVYLDLCKLSAPMLNTKLDVARKIEDWL